MRQIISTSWRFLVLMSLIYACSSEKENLLLGKWQATQLTENGKPLEMDLKEVYFNFDEQDRYHFSSTLNYREAGFYQHNNNLLYTTDTLTPNKSRKAVKIIKLDDQLLELEMEDHGKKRVLLLKKAGALEE